jgi:hypothetical protein
MRPHYSPEFSKLSEEGFGPRDSSDCHEICALQDVQREGLTGRRAAEVGGREMGDRNRHPRRRCGDGAPCVLYYSRLCNLPRYDHHTCSPCRA